MTIIDTPDPLRPLGEPPELLEEATAEQQEVIGLSQGQIVRRRFLRHKGAMLSLALLFFIVLLAATSIGWGPIPGWWKWDYTDLVPPTNVQEPTLSIRPTWLGGDGIHLGDHPFGLDNQNGKDMFAMTMRGVQTSLAVIVVLGVLSTAIGVTIGDFATTRVEGRFRLAYLVFNTINNLTTPAEQVACFRNAAAHLEPGGFFVVEVGVPPLRLVPPGQRFYTYNVSDTKWDIDEFDFATQQFYSHHFSVRDGRLDRNSIPFRYVWPSELDLMAQLAGMELAERWENWRREPFTAESRKHVSVWKLPEA